MEAGAPAGPAAASTGSAALTGDPGRLTGRPPLPRSLPPSSANSSRASSPGRGGLSAQASLHTLFMNRLAQYRREAGRLWGGLLAARTQSPSAPASRCLLPSLARGLGHHAPHPASFLHLPTLQPPHAHSGPMPLRGAASTPATWLPSAPRLGGAAHSCADVPTCCSGAAWL